MTTQDNTVDSKPVELIFSRDGRHYYVSRWYHLRPRSWVAVDADGDGKFETLPFAMYEVKSGAREQRPESDALVQRYALAEGWPDRGSTEWREGATAALDRVRKLLAENDRSAALYRKEIARLHEERRVDESQLRLDVFSTLDAHLYCVEKGPDWVGTLELADKVVSVVSARVCALERQVEMWKMRAEFESTALRQVCNDPERWDPKSDVNHLDWLHERLADGLDVSVSKSCGEYEVNVGDGPHRFFVGRGATLREALCASRSSDEMPDGTQQQ